MVCCFLMKRNCFAVWGSKPRALCTQPKVPIIQIIPAYARSP